MRLIPVLILLAIVLGIGYVFVFQRDWIFKKGQEGVELAAGYGNAKTPADALDLFRQAIRDRKYSTAAKYCTGDYAEQLAGAHDAASTLGGLIDRLMTWMEGKSMKTDKSVKVLYLLDPFPKNFIIAGVSKKTGDDKAVGSYQWEVLSAFQADISSESNSMDPKMFGNCLLNPAVLGSIFKPGAVEIVAEGKGDDQVWKLKIPLLPGQAQAIAHLKDNYKRYQTGMERFLREVNNERYGSRNELEKELLRVLQEAK